jgi:hypothetical protein
MKISLWYSPFYEAKQFKTLKLKSDNCKNENLKLDIEEKYDCTRPKARCLDCRDMPAVDAGKIKKGIVSELLHSETKPIPISCLFCSKSPKDKIEMLTHLTKTDNESDG